MLPTYISQVIWQAVPGSGSRGEADWLAKVSLAFARLGLGADQRAARLSGASRTAPV